MNKFEIEAEVAEHITLSSLKWHLNYLEEEMRRHTEEGKWMHPDDKLETVNELIPSFRKLIEYFGGE